MSYRWRDRAACAGMDTELFFERGPMKPEIKAVCRRCPVKVDCAQDALEHEDEGVRGGLTLAERERL